MGTPNPSEKKGWYVVAVVFATLLIIWLYVELTKCRDQDSMSAAYTRGDEYGTFQEGLQGVMKDSLPELHFTEGLFGLGRSSRAKVNKTSRRGNRARNNTVSNRTMREIANDVNRGKSNGLIYQDIQSNRGQSEGLVGNDVRSDNTMGISASTAGRGGVVLPSEIITPMRSSQSLTSGQSHGGDILTKTDFSSATQVTNGNNFLSVNKDLSQQPQYRAQPLLLQYNTAKGRIQ